MPKSPAKKTKQSLKTSKGNKSFKKQSAQGGWNSVNYSKNRTALYAPPVQDQRRDLSPRDRIEMMRRLRWGDRNSGMVRQILGDLVQYSIGDGIRHQSHAKNAKLYEDYFTEWCKKCDITNRFNFWQVQSILLRSAARDGDSFAIKTRNAGDKPKLQLVEAHRVGNPLPPEKEPDGMFDGIRFGAYGELVGYNVYKSDGMSREIIAPAVMHIIDHEYASGARGVPVLQHSWNDVQDEMELLAIEKTAAKTSAQISLVINKTGGTIDDNMASELGATAPTNYGDVAASMGGNILALDVGESVQSVQSNRPSPTFTGFLEAIQRDISRGVLPYEFIGDPSKTNGGALRMVVAKADRVFQKWQNIIIEQLCVPTWGYVIGDAIANGELPDDPDWNKVSWTTPKRVTVDAGREAANDRADVELGLLSMSELYAQRGLDFRSEMAKRAEDMAYIVNLAKQTGLPIEMLYKPTNVQPGTLAPLAPKPYVEESDANLSTDELINQNEDNQD
jgi:capsid protein